MKNRHILFGALVVLWGIYFPSTVLGDYLVAPRKQSCEQGFKETYKLLEKGYQPYLMNAKECPISHTLLTWLWLLKHGKNATLDDYRLFLESKDHWPLLNKIQEGGENLLNNKTDAGQVLAFFKGRNPLTSLGMIHYVRALFAVGRERDAVISLRTFWRENNFNASNERFFYKKFKKHLLGEDHQKRLDRLAIEGNYYGLKRMLKRVSKRGERLIQATAALARFQPMTDFYVRRLKGQEQNNIGIIYQRIKWRLKKGKRKEAQELFLKAESDGHINAFAPQWFKYRYYFARSLFQKKAYAQAYSILKKHGLNPKMPAQLTDYAAAEWFLGWLSLRHLNRPSQAAVHFRNMLRYVRTPVSKAKASYWLGRSMKALGKMEESRRWHKKAAGFPHVFYGQESLKILGEKPSFTLKTTPKACNLSAKERALRVAIKLLYDTNPKDIHLKSFIIHMARQCRSGQQENFIGWMRANGLDRWLVLCSKIAGRKGPIFLRDSFPVQAFEKRILSHPHLSEVFLHGLIRQESGFDVGIKSSAGACGMMQIMPRVAKKLCKKLKIPYKPQSLTSDPHYNIRIGSFFLNSLMEQFQDNKILSLAAYNAGETAVRRWLKEYGDPRAPSVDTLDWIESIPFSETRTYVMRIFESLPLYEVRLRKS